MRPTSAGLFFALLFLCFMVIIDGKTQALRAITQLQLRYDNALDNAVEDAMFLTAEKDSGREVTINKEEVVENFFAGLFNNMGIMDNPGSKNQMRVYVPFIAIVEQDGFWLWHHQSDPMGEGKMGFGEKQRFLWEDGEYEIAFTLTEFVTVTEKRSREQLSGNYHDVEKLYPCKIFANGTFDLVRRNTITHYLTEAFTKAVGEHNQIARQYGITYDFFLPFIEKEDWYRTIDHMGMLVLFQGYPYGTPSMGYYNRIAFSGARIRKIR